MNLKHLDLLEESDKGWRVRDRRDGSSFSVARFGLSPATADAITQHFAHGGVVKKPKGYAEGGPVEPLTLPQQMQRIGLQTLGPMIPAVGPAMSVVQAGEGLAQLRNPALRSKIANVAGDVATAVNPVPELTNALGITKPRAPEPMGAPPSGSETAPLTITQPETPQPQATGPTSVRASFQLPGGSITGGDRELVAASQQAQKALQDQARIAGERAQAEGELAQGYALKREALSQEWEQRFAANQARADQMAQDIATSKMDPSRFWNSRDTGQKVMASIGLILGGLGAGLSGGPNYAMQVIDKAIEKDIDAQEKDLGRKQNLLQHYMQQGHSLREAKQLAAADAKDIYAAQLEAAAPKFAGPEAAAKASGLAANIRTETVKNRQGLLNDQLKNRLNVLEMEEKLRAKNIARMVAPGKMRGNIPISEKEEADYRAAFDARGQIQAGIQEYKALAKKYGTEAFNTEAGQRMGALESDLKLTIKDLAKLGALSESDLKLVEAQVPSFRSLTPERIRNGVSALDQLSRNIDRRVLAKERSLGILDIEQPRVGGLVSVPRKP